MMDTVKEILASFDSLSLKELEVVRLLDRMDTKYVFNSDKLPEVLSELKAGYRILEIQGARQSCYQTIYFDTDDLCMYHHHHNGKASRYKVRLRRYCDSGINYLEIKHRNNKGRTIKTRIKKPQFTTDLEENACALIRRTPFRPESLKPVLKVSYTRMTFADRGNSTRLTIDTGLHFSQNGNGKSYESLVIAEIKQSRAVRSNFHVIMQKQRIPSVSVSKYCLGIANLYDGIRKNNFKRKLLQINKVIHHGS
jgi:SPX domain protein involved in polyphosphate accumulation